MGFPYKDSKAGKMAQEFANRDNISYEDACKKYGLITLEDPLPDFIKENKEKIYALAKRNGKYNEEGQAVIEKDDPWRDETEWDILYESLNRR